MKKLLFSFMIFGLTSCNSFTVSDVNIKIKPYDKADRGKFWSLCVDYDKIGYSDQPIAYFELKTKDGKTGRYSNRFDTACESFNVLVVFANRQTPHSEWEWLKSLEAEDFEYIKVKIKSHPEEKRYVFVKKFLAEDLKN